MSAIASASAGSSSPPAKRPRQEAFEQVRDEGNVRSFARHRVLTGKEQAKRIKARLKDRQKSLDKLGEEPIFYDICELLGQEKVDSILAQDHHAEFEQRFHLGQTVTCRIVKLSSHGDGLAVHSDSWVVAVPHTVPGELVEAKICSNERMYSKASLVRLVEPATPAETSSSVLRRDSLVKCKYYDVCSGCQYQHVSYDDQLNLKRDVVRKAFRHYSNLAQTELPDVRPTLPSPLQYAYRTKLTPHFELPRGLRKRRGGGKGDRPLEKPSELPDVAIGFDEMGSKRVVDIEECVIGTATINAAMPKERARIKDSIHMYKNGATLLLRDSLVDFHQDTAEVITDHKAVVKEVADSTKFLSPAGAFFQNNRSILPSLVEYVRREIAEHSGVSGADQERFLVDAYCGSGLFSLCLASAFKRVAGVEISQDSIRYAKQNARLNGIDNVDFIAGDAQEIFKHISFPSHKTVAILDPPRRGCDQPFIKQLLALGPQLIVYVSCNVHTQARDVGQIINGLEGAPKRQYKVMSLCGADLFPQTYHVEGICVLQRTDK
jgi:tRNA (uracil-5-)-methyltransferase